MSQILDVWRNVYCQDKYSHSIQSSTTNHNQNSNNDNSNDNQWSHFIQDIESRRPPCMFLLLFSSVSSPFSPCSPCSPSSSLFFVVTLRVTSRLVSTKQIKCYPMMKLIKTLREMKWKEWQIVSSLQILISQPIMNTKKYIQ